MERKRFLAAAAGVGAVLASASAAFADATPMPMRGEHASNANVRHIRERLEEVIDNLSRDQHDYGGHREKALDFLQKAREQLLAAENWAATHKS